MADDPVAAALDRLREDMVKAASALTPGLSPQKAIAAGTLHGSALKALGALGAVATVHRPRLSFGRLVCGHDTDAGGGTLLAAWPCRTYAEISAALTGKEESDGG